MPVDSVLNITSFQLEPMAETSDRNQKEENRKNHRNKKETTNSFQRLIEEQGKSEDVDIYRQTIDSSQIIKLLAIRPNPALFQNKIIITYLKEQIENSKKVSKNNCT